MGVDLNGVNGKDVILGKVLFALWRKLRMRTVRCTKRPSTAGVESAWAESPLGRVDLSRVAGAESTWAESPGPSRVGRVAPGPSQPWAESPLGRVAPLSALIHSLCVRLRAASRLHFRL
jgi:hypothetical protein